MIGLDRIREAARKDKNLQFNNLMHHITIDLLEDAYYAQKREASPGVDKVTYRQYTASSTMLIITVSQSSLNTVLQIQGYYV